jgi:hypothetical protein
VCRAQSVKDTAMAFHRTHCLVHLFSIIYLVLASSMAYLALARSGVAAFHLEISAELATELGRIMQNAGRNSSFF